MFNNMYKQEWLLIKRQSCVWAMPCLFFILVMTVMLFALGPFEQTLYPFIPRLMLIVAMLSLFMQAEQLFKSDWADGTLTQYYLSKQGMLNWLLIRLSFSALTLVVPLILMSGVTAWLSQVPQPVVLAMLSAMALALPSLFLITAFAGGLTVVLPQSGLLNALILMPLYVPILLFTETIIVRAQWGEPYHAFILLLFSILLCLMLLMPWVIQTCLKQVLR